MTTPLTAVPAALTSGDSLDLLLSPSDYPASDGWVVSLILAGPSVLTKTSTASGSDHSLTISAAESAALDAGGYEWRTRAALGTVTQTFGSGRLEVFANLATATAGSVATTAQWDELIAACDAALLDLITGGMKSYQVAGRQVQFNSETEVRRTRAYAVQQKSAFTGPLPPVIVGRTGSSPGTWI